ncbi:LacI family DNA-binding transcriptional regulator [Litorisediminicola beolgyonensis]|uniref:LacI family DNA-binding transcriptional regulator n=1 Tax=Litorisediminicola beolgyonensis TaxID=1173614 RepID=A0ABW3ZNV9_9RHOB
MRSGTNPTVNDVATAAGVSTATVSRCINSPEVVQPDTLRRVRAAIDTLGYAPNFGARALAAKRTNTVGAIVPTLENAIFARGLEAVQRELAAAGSTMLVSSSSYDPEQEAEQIRTLVARGADALLLIGFERSAEIYDFLDRRKIPHVVAWAFAPDQPRPAVGFDNRAAMRALAEKTLAFGHRRIGLVTAQREGNDRAQNRWLGLLDAMRAAGLGEDDLSLQETVYDIESGRAAAHALLTRDPRPTVIMCGNDVLAAGAMIAARELGLSVPEDVSITGFDDIEIARVLTPQLTTVHVPHREMGRRAARMLIDMRDDATAADSVELGTEVILRGTLGPAPVTP